MKTYRLTLSTGKYLDFPHKESLINWLNENWGKEYYITIREIHGSGCCGFKVKEE